MMELSRSRQVNERERNQIICTFMENIYVVKIVNINEAIGHSDCLALKSKSAHFKEAGTSKGREWRQTSRILFASIESLGLRCQPKKSGMLCQATGRTGRVNL